MTIPREMLRIIKKRERGRVILETPAFYLSYHKKVWKRNLFMDGQEEGRWMEKKL